MAVGYGDAFSQSFLAARQQIQAEDTAAADNEIKMGTYKTAQDQVAADKAIQDTFQQIVDKDGLTAGLEYYQSVKPKEGTDILKTIADTKLSIANTLKTNAETAGVNISNDAALNKLTTDAMDFIGGFGSSLMQMPENERQQAFEAMLPKLQTLDKNFPTNFSSAQSYLKGAAALAVPQNKIFEAEQAMARSQTETIKSIEYLNKNKDKLSEDQIKAIEADQNKSIEAQAKAKVDKLSAQMKQTGEGEDALRKELMTETAGYREAASSTLQLKQAINAEGSFANHAAIVNYIKAVNPNARINMEGVTAMKDLDGIPEKIGNLLNESLKGPLELSKKDRAEIVAAADSVMNAREAIYKQTRGYYTDMARDRGFDVRKVDADWDQRYQAAQQSATLRSLPPELQQDAKAAMEAGYTPDQIQQYFNSNLKGK